MDSYRNACSKRKNKARKWGCVRYLDLIIGCLLLLWRLLQVHGILSTSPSGRDFIYLSADAIDASQGSVGGERMPYAERELFVVVLLPKFFDFLAWEYQTSNRLVGGFTFRPLDAGVLDGHR